LLKTIKIKKGGGKMRYLTIFILFFLLANVAWALEIKSSAFENGAYIPVKYSCSSLDISPSLEWSDIPEGTKSFAIICDDPDAPSGVWVHWVIYNIPADKRSLEENIPKISQLSDGIIQGRNDFGSIGYGGPCPPLGSPHRYFFTIYALDTVLHLNQQIIEKKELIQAMQGHILAEAHLIGLFKR